MPTLYDTRNRTDYSRYAVHFTRDRGLTAPDLISATHPVHPFQTQTAFDRLKNIISSQVIYGTPMPWLPNNPQAVCFTECVWESLVEMADSYSSYGLVFNKRTLYQRGGGPALYLRGDALTALNVTIPPLIEPLITPFDPYATIKEGVALDWLHEREWRVPGDFSFQDRDVEFIIVKTLEDAREFLTTFGSTRFLPNKIIPMQVYSVIRDSWGTTAAGH